MSPQINKMLEMMGRHGISQADLARHLKIKPQAINNWKVRGVIPPRNLAKLSVLLGASMEELAEGASATSKDVPQLLKVFHCLSQKSRQAVLDNANALLDAESPQSPVPLSPLRRFPS